MQLQNCSSPPPRLLVFCYRGRQEGHQEPPGETSSGECDHIPHPFTCCVPITKAILIHDLIPACPVTTARPSVRPHRGPQWLGAEVTRGTSNRRSLLALSDSWLRSASPLSPGLHLLEFLRLPEISLRQTEPHPGHSCRLF